MVVSPINHAEGCPVHLLAVSRDVAALKQEALPAPVMPDELREKLLKRLGRMASGTGESKVQGCASRTRKH